MTRDGLDPRTWLVWGVAASLPPLLGRNPWPLLATLIAVAGVRIAWAGRMRGAHSWRLLLRLAVILSVVSVLFNILTVRAGNVVLFELPSWLPLLDGDVTLNAAIFGVLSGLALVLLVAIGATVAALLDWTALVRLLPQGLTTVAVAGSVAFAFVPQTAVAFREIREAQMARGFRPRGARDVLPILVPLLEGGLERALTLAASLESRGFGNVTPGTRTAGWRRWALAGSLAAGALAAYEFAVANLLSAAIAAAAAAGLGAVALFGREAPAIRRTSYRKTVWTARDALVTGCSLLATALFAFVLAGDPDGLRYEPYPRLTAPPVSLMAIAAALLAAAPAFVAPAGAGRSAA